jgi:hypothetical protein
MKVKIKTKRKDYINTKESETKNEGRKEHENENRTENKNINGKENADIRKEGNIGCSTSDVAHGAMSEAAPHARRVSKATLKRSAPVKTR